MQELLYFTFADLLLSVVYDKKNNIFQYRTHRAISPKERIVIDQYLLSKVAIVTDYYKRQESGFLSLGVDIRLVKALDKFHATNASKKAKKDNSSIQEVVSQLVTDSMSEYYFEKVGEEIMILREEMKGLHRQCKIMEYKNNLAVLLKAYNKYGSKKISLDEILPKEFNI